MENPKINSTQLHAKAQDFAELFNAMVEAGYAAGFAADTAAKVVGQCIEVKCNCK